VSKARGKRKAKPRTIPRSVAITAGRSIAAGEVLAAVWLKDFELDVEIDNPPTTEIDEYGHTWVNVRIHVPALDIDMWETGEHGDHPDNAKAKP
jgi:hypothetical protein